MWLKLYEVVEPKVVIALLWLLYCVAFEFGVIGVELMIHRLNHIAEESFPSRVAVMDLWGLILLGANFMVTNVFRKDLRKFLDLFGIFVIAILGVLLTCTIYRIVQEKYGQWLGKVKPGYALCIGFGSLFLLLIVGFALVAAMVIAEYYLLDAMQAIPYAGGVPM